MEEWKIRKWLMKMKKWTQTTAIILLTDLNLREKAPRTQKDKQATKVMVSIDNQIPEGKNPSQIKI